MLKSLLRRIISAILLVAFGVASSTFLSATDDPPSQAVPSVNDSPQTPDDAAAPANPSTEEFPPATDEQYIGTNQCFQCHRPQTNTWSETKHAHALTDMPEKYRSDASCLKCHTTGFGEPSGYVADTDKDLSMVGCEACHGPGAAHVDAANRFVLAMPGEEEKIEKEMRDTIIKAPTDSACIVCHISQTHHNHPPYERPLSPQIAGSTADKHDYVAQSSATITAADCSFSGYSVKTCGGCHYGQYKQWRAEKHSALSFMLSPRYLKDPNCQGCHPSADAVATSPVANDNPNHNQIGLACESCHGPGLDHVRFTRQLINTWPLGSRLEQAARQSISNGRPVATCIRCHLEESHRPHPEFAAQ